jgi:hypothetical protein
VLIVGQAAARLLATASPDTLALAALGMTRRQLTSARLSEVAAAAAAGAIMAAGVAVAASPLMPIGAARLAEPNPGVSADVTVLAAGATAIVVLLVAWAGWPAWQLASEGARRSGTPAAPGLSSRLAAWLGGAGAPVTATTGVRLALEPGRGRTAVPVRAALAGTALSVLAVTAALTFGASLAIWSTPRVCMGSTGTPQSICNMTRSHQRPPGTGSAACPASLAGRSAITASSGSAAMSSRRSG